MNGILVNAARVRDLVTGYVALRLDMDISAEITLLPFTDGGGVYADVTSTFEPGVHFARKHLGQPKYEAFSIPISSAMTPGLFDWVAGSWGAQPQKRNGAVLLADANFNIKSETAFANALVVETEVPALDAAAKDPGFLNVRFQPEVIDVRPGSGKLSLISTKQALWRASWFRLQITGLECRHVTRIDSFTVRRNFTVATSGSGEVSLVPDPVDFPNLRITLASASAETWFDWHQSFVVEGNNDDSHERAGVISLLSNDFQRELSRVELSHLGIIKLAPQRGEGASKIARVTAELYCDEMRLVARVKP